MDKVRTALHNVSIVVLGLMLIHAISVGFAQDVIPDQIVFKYETIRKLLPKDGELKEHGQIGKEYVGISLGHEVTAEGKKIVVGQKLGSPGIVFGDGYVKIHLGAHIETEVPKGGPTLAANVVAGVYLTINDNRKVRLELRDDDLDIRGDNLGGKLAVAVKKAALKELVRSEVEKLAGELTKFIDESKIPKELKVVMISPKEIVIAKDRPKPPPTRVSVTDAEYQFHTTSDDREGGIVKIEFYENERTKFAEIPALAEKPEWPERNRHNGKHKFGAPVLLPTNIAFALVSLTEAQEKNIGWNFEVTITLKTDDGQSVVFEGKNLRLDTTGGRYPATKSLKVPRTRP